MVAKILTQISFWLVIIGALNWGLVGVFGFNLVDGIFGVMSLMSRLVYILVGAGAIWLIVDLFRAPETLGKIK